MCAMTYVPLLVWMMSVVPFGWRLKIASSTSGSTLVESRVSHPIDPSSAPMFVVPDDASVVPVEASWPVATGDAITSFQDLPLSSSALIASIFFFAASISCCVDSAAPVAIPGVTEIM